MLPLAPRLCEYFAGCLVYLFELLRNSKSLPFLFGLMRLFQAVGQVVAGVALQGPGRDAHQCRYVPIRLAAYQGALYLKARLMLADCAGARQIRCSLQIK